MMHRMSTVWTLLSLAMLALATTPYLKTCHAYSVVKPLSSRTLSSTPIAMGAPFGATRAPIIRRPTWLQAEAQGEAQDDNEQDQEQQQDQEEEVPEDPEMTQLKVEIANLEKTLKEKKSQINYLKDSAENYSKAGYARKVAEMENMRRARSSMASSNRETSIAIVLREFLPVKDKLDMLREKYGNDEFGKQYVALAGNFNTALTEMGVTEYTAKVGEPVDRTRVLVVDEEPSTAQPKGTVLRPLTMGLELKGNVIRLAECVGSLGDESEEEEAAEEVEAAEEEEEEAGVGAEEEERKEA